MSAILEHMPPRPMITARRCAYRACRTVFTPKRKDGLYCRKKCRRDAWNGSRRQRNHRTVVSRDRIPAEFGVAEFAPKSMLCACGGAMTCQIVREKTVEWCPRCQTERTVVVQGLANRFKKHKGDLDLAGEVKRAQTRVQKRVVSHVGDAWRQSTHKKGVASNL